MADMTGRVREFDDDGSFVIVTKSVVELEAPGLLSLGGRTESNRDPFLIVGLVDEVRAAGGEDEGVEIGHTVLR